jgi:hypothetical protein
MAQISVADAAFAGFGLIGRKPLAVAGWGAAYIVFVLLLLLLLGGALAAPLMTLASQGGAPNPATIAPFIAGFLGLFLVIVIASLFFQSVISAAVMRAVLEPEKAAFAYIRFGAQELWLVAVFLVQGLVIFAVYLVGAIFVGVLAALARGNAAIAFIGILAVVVAIFYLLLRFSLAGPLSFAERKFGLFESWSLTRGSAGSLFLVALILVAVSIGLFIANSVLSLIVSLLTMGVSGISATDPSQTAALLQNPMAMLARMGPFVIVQLLLLAVFYGIYTAVGQAPWAQAYAQLRPAAAEVASTFS